ncbi:hypothetical protein FHH43_11970 [Clostridium perfringens]|nr:hypothetical protein [Clostridium perfringens]
MKILIFGIVASGKTTLAKKLSKELSIPYFEDDCIAWGFLDGKRYKHSDEEQKSIIEKIDKNESWIIEGTYRKSQQLTYDLANQVANSLNFKMEVSEKYKEGFEISLVFPIIEY